MILIKIKIPKNKKGVGLFIENFSLFPKEEEFLLPPNTKLKLLSKNENFKYYHTNSDFEKIINREIPADIIYEDELSIVIKDIQPQAPTHLLIIPKKVIPKLSDGLEEDKETLGHLMLVAGKVADLLNLDDTFRIVINNGAKAGQSVFHLHLHLLSGRSLNWPPG